MIARHAQKNFIYFRKYNRKKIPFYKICIVNKKDVEEPFKKDRIYSVIHFAGKKAVGESVEKPLLYYEKNFIRASSLIKLCLKYKVNNFISPVLTLFMKQG